jgi:hypothetical protein
MGGPVPGGPGGTPGGPPPPPQVPRCDPTPLRNWLLAIGAAILTSVATIVGAAVANGSYWYVYLAPIGMLVAAGFAGLALLFCGFALSALNAICACTSGRCKGQCDNLSNVLNAARVVLGVQATACLTVAAYAWIPGAAQPAMWTIIGSLIVEAALIFSAIGFYSALADCAAKSG